MKYFTNSSTMLVMDSKEKTIAQLFEEQVAKTPDATAISFGKESLTYAELNAHANQLARYIRKQYKKQHQKDLVPDTLVGIYVERSIGMFVALLAVLKAGGAYIPLDPNYPEARLKYMLEDSKISLILTQKHLANKVAAYGVFIDVASKVMIKEKDTNLKPISDINDLAYVIYTSGSTGKPKGVMVEQKGVCNFIQKVICKLFAKCGTRVLQFVTICFDAAAVDWAGALLCGKELVLISNMELPPNKKITDILLKKKINIAPLVPAVLEVAAYKKLPDLKLIIVGGDRCTPKIVNRWGKGRTFINLYGPTETTIFSTLKVCKPNKKITIGKPIANTQVYVLDENLKSVAYDTIGELYIGGIGVARGYLNRPDLTQELFINYNNHRVYKTGDLVRPLSNGELEFVGRNDQQVKIRGFRIELGEIEKVLYQHESIEQAVVKVLEDEKTFKRLVAYYVLKKDQNLSKQEARNYLLQSLPKYMVPAFFVAMEKFPLNSSGKVDRKNLLSPFTVTTKSKITGLNSETEHDLISIWSEILAVPAIHIGVFDSFFALGGDSLRITSMLIEIKERFQTDIKLIDFMGNPTIYNLTQIIAGTQAGIGYNVMQQKIAHELSLSAKIKPLKRINPDMYQPKAVLLTGVTGFLGIYLLDQIISQTKAEVYCLVRASNKSEARKKLQQNIRNHKLLHLLNNNHIKVVVGDLEEPLVGIAKEDFHKLATKIDSIYHCGAFVHHIYDYNYLHAANVHSTLELLKFASKGKNKHMHFISTVSSVSNFDADGYATEEGPTDMMPKVPSGYALTKWISERLLWLALNRGHKITIYRPGNITGDSKYGICHPEHNHLLLLLKGCIQLGFAPAWEVEFELLEVDTLAAGIVGLSLRSQSEGKAYNVHNPYTLTWCQLIQWTKEYGFALELIAPDKWTKKLVNIDKSNAIFPLVNYYIDGGYGDLGETEKIKFDNTQAALQEIGVNYPHYNKDYIFKLLDYLVNNSFFA